MPLILKEMIFIVIPDNFFVARIGCLDNSTHQTSGETP